MEENKSSFKIAQDGADAFARSSKLGIYIHVPYCVRKCRYCDFVSFPMGDGELAGCAGGNAPYRGAGAGKAWASCPAGSPEDYFARLGQQIDEAGRLYSERFSIGSVFFGGGTPSAVDPSLVCGALARLKDAFDFEEGAEISLEANPGTVSAESLAAYRAAGFNRRSLGIQSFDDRVLGIMGRIHSSAEAEEAVRLARESFPNVNVDLMMGVPGQTLRSWEDSLRRAIELGVQHISFYSLQLEEGTPFFEDYRAGRLELPDWEENRAMYRRALEMLKDGGYRHYEVSNAARPGFECAHNLRYWTMEPYLGLGMAAHSFIDGVRFSESVRPDGAAPDVSELKGDFVFTQLRLIDGLNTELYKKLFGCGFEEDFGEALEELIAEGMLRRSGPDGERIAFTAEGLDRTNPVMERLLEEL
jgi:oxygen-independent coproporphyrinogen-3 oxidase